MGWNIFSIGETVQLKSGGPLMTVIDESKPSDEVTCTWFSKNGKRYEHVFKKFVLIGISALPNNDDVPC